MISTLQFFRSCISIRLRMRLLRYLLTVCCRFCYLFCCFFFCFCFFDFALLYIVCAYLICCVVFAAKSHIVNGIYVCKIINVSFGVLLLLLLLLIKMDFCCCYYWAFSIPTFLSRFIGLCVISSVVTFISFYSFLFF